MAGRREVPVDPAAGPVQRFAFELRKLRTDADGVTYRELSRRAGYSVTTLSRAAAGEQLPTLPVALAYVRACGGDSAEWEARWREAAESAGPPGDDGSVPPYRGLARFETGDSALFFGREQLTADLVDLLRRRRFAAVFGPSGSGKSSLLRAGLIPALRQARDPRPAAIRILTPGEHPARHEPLLTPANTPADALHADTFLLVDQFEEIFTLCQDPAERTHFINLLLTARSPDSRLRVLLAVRGDFYGRCAEHRPLADALRDANLLAGAMSSAELRDAVVKPATTAGLTVERALTARLVEEVADAPGGLPLLSHALLETWRLRRGKTLTLEGYETAGRLDGAIARTAETVYGSFTEQQATAARRLLLRLITPGDNAPDSRRPLALSELPPDTPPLLEALTTARLLTLDGDTVELSHEALITAWPRLRTWIEEDRERLRTHRNLTSAAHSWRELGREQGALYRGTRLASAREQLAREDLTEAELAFLDASHAHERRARRRARLILTAVTGALCLALVAAGLAVGQWRSAVDAQRLAESRQLAAQSSALLDSDPDLAALLAVHAYRTSPTGEATSALYAAAALPLRKRLTLDARVSALALSPDGRTLAVYGADSVVRILESPGGRVRHVLTGWGDFPLVKFSPDGRSLAATTSGGVTVWDAVTGRKAGHLAVPGGVPRDMDFSPDGRTLAVASPQGVRVWDVATGRTQRLPARRSDPEAVAFGPDGRSLAVAELGGTVRVLDVATGRTRAVREHRLTAGDEVVFSPDRRTYAVSVHGSSVQLRDVPTGALLHTLGDSGRQPVFAPDGRTLAVPGPGDTVRLWDTASGTPRTDVAVGHRGTPHVALGPDGTLVTSDGDDVVRIHGRPADRPRTTLRGPAGTYLAQAAFGPDGRTLAAVFPSGYGPLGESAGSVRLWDTSTGAPLAARPASWTNAVGFGPDGRALWAGLVGGGVVEVRDVRTGRLYRSRALGAVSVLALTRDGTRLAVVGPEGSTGVWHLSSDTPRTVRTGDGDPVRTTAFAPDGRELAVVRIRNHGEEVTLLDTATGRTRLTFGPGIGSVLSVAFSPDGRTLATVGGGSVRTWDTRTGEQRRKFGDGVDGSPTFSPDGRTLAVRAPGAVLLWDLATGRLRRTLPTRAPSTTAFAPDGRTLAVGTGDSVQLWDVDLPDPEGAVRVICARVDVSRRLRGVSDDTGCGAAFR
ncbi:MAG TPA: helix-turn-helix domain-containing protein [Streptomyces sp.]